ncbi:MAG: class I SAM-dependent methyltransferase [Planctomycetota bacterium]
MRIPDWLADRLVSPKSGQPYQMTSHSSLQTEAGEKVPIQNDIPRFIQQEEYVESFGFQWNRFDVLQVEEDESTFELKVGVTLDQLAEKVVLDAGCGGGRYAWVAGKQGAKVIAVDRSQAVEKARRLTHDLPTVAVIQADLMELPLRQDSFDLVYSIGVLHHAPDTRAAFLRVAKMVRPGGRLSVWIYRKNRLPQEWLNNLLRAIGRRIPRGALLAACRGLALLGGVPVLNRSLNKVFNFSNHPRWENRVCDNFDWYAPYYQHHHTLAEVMNWFRDAGYQEIRELNPLKSGQLYLRLFHGGWIIGSGVNVTGVRRANPFLG